MGRGRRMRDGVSAPIREVEALPSLIETPVLAESSARRTLSTEARLILSELRRILHDPMAPFLTPNFGRPIDGTHIDFGDRSVIVEALNELKHPSWLPPDTRWSDSVQDKYVHRFVLFLMEDATFLQFSGDRLREELTQLNSILERLLAREISQSAEGALSIGWSVEQVRFRQALIRGELIRRGIDVGFTQERTCDGLLTLVEQVDRWTRTPTDARATKLWETIEAGGSIDIHDGNYLSLCTPKGDRVRFVPEFARALRHRLDALSPVEAISFGWTPPTESTYPSDVLWSAETRVGQELLGDFLASYTPGASRWIAQVGNSLSTGNGFLHSAPRRALYLAEDHLRQIKHSDESAGNCDYLADVIKWRWRLRFALGAWIHTCLHHDVGESSSHLEGHRLEVARSALLLWVNHPQGGRGRVRSLEKYAARLPFISSGQYFAARGMSEEYLHKLPTPVIDTIDALLGSVPSPIGPSVPSEYSTPVASRSEVSLSRTSTTTSAPPVIPLPPPSTTPASSTTTTPSPTAASDPIQQLDSKLRWGNWPVPEPAINLAKRTRSQRVEAYRQSPIAIIPGFGTIPVNWFSNGPNRPSGYGVYAMQAVYDDYARWALTEKLPIMARESGALILNRAAGGTLEKVSVAVNDTTNTNARAELLVDPQSWLGEASGDQPIDETTGWKSLALDQGTWWRHLSERFGTIAPSFRAVARVRGADGNEYPVAIEREAANRPPVLGILAPSTAFPSSVLETLSQRFRACLTDGLPENRS